MAKKKKRSPAAGGAARGGKGRVDVAARLSKKAAQKKGAGTGAPEIVVFTKAGGPLTKRISLNEDGSIKKDNSAGIMARGQARRAKVADVEQLAALIEKLRSEQAIALGALRADLPDEVEIVTKDKLDGQSPPNVIARTSNDIVYRKGRPAFVLLDYDTKGMPPAVAARLEALGGFWGALVAVLPALGEAAHLLRHSTSAGLLRGDTGEQLKGSDGLHGYIIAQDGADAVRFLKTLHARCWLRGLGWLVVGSAGQLLERSIVDRMVGASERLVFEGPPILEPPLKQDVVSRRPVVTAGKVVDTMAVCPELTADEQTAFRKLHAEAAEQLSSARAAAREAFVSRQVEKLVRERGISVEQATRVIESLCKGILTADFVLPFDDPKLSGCTVADVLADPARFKDCTLADPIEGVDYGRCKAMVMLRADGTPWIHSFAHGRTIYELRHEEPLEAESGVSLDDFYAYMPQHNYIFTPSREPWPASSVNARIAPIIFGDDNEMKASAWLDRNKPIEQMTWAPGLPMLIRNRLIAGGGWIERNGVSCFNLYRPPTLELGDAAQAGLWIDHAKKVFGDDAEHIIKWLAHRVQRPQEKINHALVLGSNDHGIGKDTLLEPVKRAIGPWNFHEVSAQQVLGRFTGFLKSVILRINEARDLGSVTRYQFYDHMKAYLATPPDVLRVDEKNLREHSVLNCVGVIITTNHKADGIYLPAEDRRHFIGWSECKREDFTDDYWRTLWTWYDNGGDHHVAAYLTQLDISSFDPKAPPPKTPAFQAIVDANRAPEDAELADVLDELGNPNVVTLTQLISKANENFEGDLGKWLADRRNRRAIPYRLEKCDYVPVRHDTRKDGLWIIKTTHQVNGREIINSARQVIYAKATLALSDQLKAAQELVMQLAGAKR